MNPEKVIVPLKELAEKYDPAIRDLVVGFWINGIRTHQSCEGHSDKERKGNKKLPYPWLIIDAGQLQKAGELLGWYNGGFHKEETDKHWVIDHYGALVRVHPKLAGFSSLKEMRDDAEKFGEELINEYVAGR